MLPVLVVTGGEDAIDPEGSSFLTRLKGLKLGLSAGAFFGGSGVGGEAGMGAGEAGT